MRERKTSGHGGAAGDVVVEHSVSLERYLPYQIYRLAALVAAPQALKAGGDAVIRAREWRVLLMLGSHGPLSGSDVAKLTYMDTGSVTRAVRELLNAGMVRSRPDRRDKRKLVLSLTPDGARIHDGIAAKRLAFSQDVMDALSIGEQDELFRLFAKLIDRVELLDSRYDEDRADS